MISQIITLLIHKNAFIPDTSIDQARPPLQPGTTDAIIPRTPAVFAPFFSHLQCTDILDIRLIIRTAEIIT